ncbi:MAG: hypothetical protein JHC95_23235 [Solirubrobacteraceae bacterium]|nr:hypothetical protein [Solirubrobacteraceae bacterium]
MERHDDYARQQEEAAAEEARHIGGDPGRDPLDGDPDRFDGRRGEAFRAVEEAGGGESEGFEESEALLEQRATDVTQPSPFVDRERTVETESGYRVSDDEYGEADSAGGQE